MDAFKVGDTVRLKSGGPTMTVENTGDFHGKPFVNCVWFEKSKCERGQFPPEALTADNGPVVA
jgi:uncharacterized protein YodC (DUF2158 family)